MHDDTNTVVITSTAKQVETNTVQEIISLLMKNPSAALVKRAKKIQKNLKTNLQEIKSLEKKLSKNTTSSSKVDTIRYKTTLCRYFSEFGTCRNGEKCQFAHGDAELPSPTEIQNMEKIKKKEILLEDLAELESMIEETKRYFIEKSEKNKDEKDFHELNKWMNDFSLGDGKKVRKKDMNRIQKLGIKL